MIAGDQLPPQAAGVGIGLDPFQQERFKLTGRTAQLGLGVAVRGGSHSLGATRTALLEGWQPEQSLLLESFQQLTAFVVFESSIGALPLE